jgi:lysophospholipase L1-like esterase
VIGLGTNGPISSQLFDQMMEALRGEQRVVFVTVKEPNYWQDEVNAVLRAGVARWPNARLADWYALSAANPGWFAPDGIHVGPAGARAYARLIADALDGP